MLAFGKRKDRVAIALAIGFALSGGTTEAQTKGVARIGWLSAQHGPRVNPGFTQALRDLGWMEGENVVIETRFAGERYDELPKLATELVQLKVDVIVTGSSVAIPAAKHATKTIPIVMAVVGVPVALGYVESIARPGGNITGLSNRLGQSLIGKRLQINL
jgi:putative ABC transport system substrate-binding protein